MSSQPPAPQHPSARQLAIRRVTLVHPGMFALLWLPVVSIVVIDFVDHGLTVVMAMVLGCPMLLSWLAVSVRSRFWSRVWAAITIKLLIEFNIMANFPIVTGSGPLGQRLLAAASLLPPSCCSS